MLQLLLIAASSVCACVPMLAFLGSVWWLDRYDREPVWLIALTFLWGAMGAIVLAVICSLLLEFVLTVTGLLLGGEPDLIAGALLPVVVAPIVEEPAKAIFLLAILWSRHFDNMTDGFVYGAAAGLGFGMTENFLYFVGVSSDVVTWSGTVLIRTFYSAVMHATASAIVGAALGFARFRHPVVLFLSGLLGLALAIGVHALWNGLLTTEHLVGTGGMLLGFNLLLFPLEFLFTLLVFEVCIQVEAATIRRELTEEAHAGRLPETHPRIIASWLRRLTPGWLPPGVDRHRYLKTATTLAMRKRQLRQLGRRASPFYQNEVDRLRGELSQILARST